MERVVIWVKNFSYIFIKKKNYNLCINLKNIPILNLIASQYPTVANCEQCSQMMGPLNRPMRCVSNIYDIFCVP